VRESVLKKPVVSPSFSKVWGSERLFLLRCSLSGVVSLPGFGKVEGTKKESSSGVFFFQVPASFSRFLGKRLIGLVLLTFLSSRLNQSKGLEGNGSLRFQGELRYGLRYWRIVFSFEGL
jgi:hypothetical protein